MDYYDIIVIGGGPAGSTLAWSLEIDQGDSRVMPTCCTRTQSGHW